jgi:hypothetical protein
MGGHWRGQYRSLVGSGGWLVKVEQERGGWREEVARQSEETGPSVMQMWEPPEEGVGACGKGLLGYELVRFALITIKNHGRLLREGITPWWR